MLRFFAKDANTKAIEKQITRVMNHMETIDVDSDEFVELLRTLERLNDVRKEAHPAPVSRDTIALIVSNILQSIIVVTYENKHVITSKAWPQLPRPKMP